MKIDTANMCSHLQKKLFGTDGIYRSVLQAIEQDDALTAVVRNRQLHIYRDGRKVLILAGKALPKFIREDIINEIVKSELNKQDIEWKEK